MDECLSRKKYGVGVMTREWLELLFSKNIPRIVPCPLPLVTFTGGKESSMNEAIMCPHAVCTSI